MRFSKYLFIVLIIAAFNSCQSPNLVDLPPAFINIIEGPKEGEVLSKDNVFFKWKGSSNDYKFKYELDILDEDNVLRSYDTAKAYANVTEHFYSNLDEGRYVFKVWGKSGSLEQSVLRHFTINAITTPTLLFVKKDNKLKLNDDFSLKIWNENIDSLIAFRVVITFDNTMIKFKSVSKTPFIRKRNFEQIILPDSLLMPNSPLIQRINQLGKIEIYSGFITRNQNQISIKGTGSLLELNFKAIAKGESFVEFTKVELVNENHKVLNAVKFGQAHILTE